MEPNHYAVGTTDPESLHNHTLMLIAGFTFLEKEIAQQALTHCRLCVRDSRVAESLIVIEVFPAPAPCLTIGHFYEEVLRLLPESP